MILRAEVRDFLGVGDGLRHRLASDPLIGMTHMGWLLGQTTLDDGQHAPAGWSLDVAFDMTNRKAEILLLIGGRSEEEAHRIRICVLTGDEGVFVRIFFPMGMLKHSVRRSALCEVYRIIFLEMELPIKWAGRGGSFLQAVLDEAHKTDRVDAVWSYLRSPCPDGARRLTGPPQAACSG